MRLVQSLRKITSAVPKQLLTRNAAYSSISYGKVSYGERDEIPQPKDSPVWSCNDWDPLEEIIVGRPDNAVIGPDCPECRSCLKPFKLEFYRQHGGKYWRDVVGKEKWDALVQDSENLVKILECEGVKVHRPDSFDFMTPYTTPTFGPYVGHDGAMARDHIFVVGNEIIEAPMAWRYRYFEFIPYRRIIMDYWRRGAKWTMGPKQALDKGFFNETYTEDMTEEERYKCVDRWVSTEQEPGWDAADFLRIGRDIVGQRSQATNLAGIEWLKRHLEPKGVRVHRLHIDEPFNLHLDVLLNIITPGVLLKRPDIPNSRLQIFENAGWKIVPAPKPYEPENSDIWKMTAASTYLSINTLFLDPKRVLVEEKETELHKLYRRFGVEAIPVKFRATQFLGGGLHCWTSDLVRRGPMKSYL